jgi:hypothetical protein
MDNPVRSPQATTLKVFFPACFVAVVLALSIGWWVLGPVVAIKGGYVFLGLLVAAGVYYLYDNPTWWDARHEMEWGLLGSGVFLLWGLALIVTELTGSRVLVLVGVLPVAYLLLALQIRRRVSRVWILLQTIALFLLSPITKYMSTGFYYARGDTIIHVGYIDRVMQSGTWTALPETSLYIAFPGFHSFISSISVLAEIDPYDGYILAGIVLYAMAIVGVYLLARLILNDTLALYVALAMTLLRPSLIYSTYFFPQAFFTVLTVIFLYILFRARVSGADRSFLMAASLLFVPSLILSHHLSIVLFLPAFVLLLTAPFVINRLSSFQLNEIGTPQALPLALLIVGAGLYWLLASNFVQVLLSAVSGIVADFVFLGSVQGSTGLRETVLYGMQMPEMTAIISLQSLGSPDGIYNIILVALLALGVVTSITEQRRLVNALSVLSVGVITSAFLLRIPLGIRGLKRFGLAMSLFIAFLVGLGLYRLFTAAEVASSRAVPALVVFVLLASSAHVVAGNDMYGLHSGPDLWEMEPLPEDQQELSVGEYRGLEEAAGTLAENEVSVTTDWISRQTLERYGTEAPGRMTLEADGIRTDNELLLYRERWSTRSQELIPDFRTFQTMVMTDQWFTEMEETESKIYTTGEVSVLRDYEGGQYVRHGDAEATS